MKRALNKNSKIKKYVLIGVLALASLLSGVALRVYGLLHTGSEDIYNMIEKNVVTGSRNYRTLKEQGSFNILILGEDNVEGSRRSDTILFATIDINDKNMRIIALPRDTRVKIARHGNQKLNHAYAFGGVDLVKSTVENYLDQPILYYFIVDYDSFPSLVDAVGGVEIDVAQNMRYIDRAGKVDINIKAGLQTLNGQTALNFVRYRKDALGDIGRVQRQQQFMKSLLKNTYDPRNIVRIPEIVSEVMKLIRTDMSPTLAIQLAGFVQNEIGLERIFFSTLPGKPTTMDNLSYWLGDSEAANEFLNAPIESLLSGDLRVNGDRFAGISIGYSSAEENSKTSTAANDDSKNSNANKPETSLTKDEMIKLIKSISEPIAVLNGSGKGGVGGEAATRFQKLGIDVVHTGNAKHFDYKYSNIIYPLKAKQTDINSAIKLGELLGTPKNLIRSNNQATYTSIVIGHDYADIITKLDNMLSVATK